MNQNLQKIAEFISRHHVMSLASSAEGELSVCSLFYAYDPQTLHFVVASDLNTQHIQNIQKNNKIAGNILLETDEVGKIQGVQFKGVFSPLREEHLKRLYYKKFPYALAMLPTLWQIKAEWFKMTDNKMGFGKKIIWP